MGERRQDTFELVAEAGGHMMPMGNNSMPPMMMMMQMYFSTGGWNEDNSFTFLFKGWSSDTLAMYVLTLAAAFALGFVQEMLACFNGNAAERLSQVYRRLEGNLAEQERRGALLDECGGTDAVETGAEEESLLAARLQASLAHGLYISWHFLAMLAIMTYNVGVCVVLCTGVTIGHFVFKTGSTRGRNGAVSCHEVTKPARYSQRGSFLD